MAIVANEQVLRKLTLVRQLFVRASLTANNQHHYVDRITSLVGFDLAVETLLKAALTSLSGKTPREIRFPELIITVNDLLRNRSLPHLPDTGYIEKWHSQRNEAQHQAKAPNDGELSHCLTNTRDFITDTVRRIWSLDFDDISLKTLIKNDQIRQLIAEGEEQLNASEYTDAVVQGMLAFDGIKQNIKSAVIGSRSSMKEKFDDRALNDLVRRLESEIETVRNLLMYIVVGVDFRNYRRYSEIVSRIIIHRYGGQKYSVTLHGRGNCTKREAEFVLEFVTNMAISVESFVGDIDKPFDLKGFLAAVRD